MIWQKVFRVDTIWTEVGNKLQVLKSVSGREFLSIKSSKFWLNVSILFPRNNLHDDSSKAGMAKGELWVKYHNTQERI